MENTCITEVIPPPSDLVFLSVVGCVGFYQYKGRECYWG